MMYYTKDARFKLKRDIAAFIEEAVKTSGR